MQLTLRNRRTRRGVAALLAAAAVGAALTGAAQAEVVDGVGPLSFTCTNSLTGPNPEPVLITISGTFPDEVEAGATATATDLVVVIDVQQGYSIGDVPGGGTLDFGPFGVVPLPAPDGGQVTEGVATYTIPEVTLTAPSAGGATPLVLEAASYKEYELVPEFTCTADAVHQVTSIDVGEAPTTTTTTDPGATTTSSGPTASTTTPGGGTRPAAAGARPVAGNPGYTG